MTSIIGPIGRTRLLEPGLPEEELPVLKPADGDGAEATGDSPGETTSSGADAGPCPDGMALDPSGDCIELTASERGGMVQPGGPGGPEVTLRDADAPTADTVGGADAAQLAVIAVAVGVLLWWLGSA